AAHGVDPGRSGGRAGADGLPCRACTDPPAHRRCLMGGPLSTPVPEPADRLARAALVRVGEPGDPRVAREVAAYGAVEAWRRVAALYPDVEPERELNVATKAGLRLICPGDDEWPPEIGRASC